MRFTSVPKGRGVAVVIERVLSRDLSLVRLRRHALACLAQCVLPCRPALQMRQLLLARDRLEHYDGLPLYHCPTSPTLTHA